MNTSTTMMYEWDQTPWRKLERSVFKLQTRIYRASCRGDVKAVHRLQRLLVKSKSAALLAVRRVTQDNQGKKTAGIDGLASLTKREKLDLARNVKSAPLVPKAQPVRRVWIPKPGSNEKRPLGIPVMEDRARQALTKLALEPEWEAKFEPNSYGFRPGRSCHDAAEAIFDQIRNVPKYVLDADIAKCFDRINHQALLTKLGTFPALRRAVKAWLKAGVMDGGELFPTEMGAPQGGVLSPLLANVALHGLATAIENAFPHHKRLPPNGRLTKWKPGVIRYADDFVVLHRDLGVIKRVQETAAEWLQGMGLEMKPSKTRITHTLEPVEGPVGFDFLGFHFRQYTRGKNRCVHGTHGDPVGFTPSIRPSSESQKRFLGKIREIVRGNRALPQTALIGLLNPVIRGWGNYFSTVVSQEVFDKMDMLIYRKLWAWAQRRHSNKGRRWVASKYWLLGTRGWTFGADEKTTLTKLSRIPIRRHTKVAGQRSPFDGDAVYWSTRMGTHPLTPPIVARLLKKQQGLCANCGLYFKLGDLMALAIRGRDQGSPLRPTGLIHRHCQDKARRVVCNDNTPSC